jgi:hypothetical protein
VVWMYEDYADVFLAMIPICQIPGFETQGREGAI